MGFGGRISAKKKILYICMYVYMDIFIYRERLKWRNIIAVKK